MLEELVIENLGIIGHLEMTFGPGLTAVTGETGAGKTMLVEAISLVVGGRADASCVRSGCTEARVEARFMVPGSGDAAGETILSRVISSTGRSRAYIDGRMATAAQLAEAGALLVDIHGQHAHQRLSSGPAQRSALDFFAGVDPTGLHRARAELRRIDGALAALGGDDAARAREVDLLTHQVTEIERAAIVSPAEESELGEIEDLLADGTRLRDALEQVAASLEGDHGAAERLAIGLRALGGLGGLADVRERLAGLHVEAEDLLGEVRRRAELASEDPGRLESVRSRRQMLRDLMRKYGNTLDEVVEFGRRARERLEEIAGHADRLEELSKERRGAVIALEEISLDLGRARRGSAGALGAAVEALLGNLAMGQARFGVSVGEAPEDPAGESVTFTLAANPGAPAAPLAKVASGGELARTMLALRLVLTEEQGTMVFDEVDAGVGGAAAVAVAGALRRLGEKNQVLVVTHLAQVAAAAHAHVGVSKAVRNGVTEVSAGLLTGEDRRSEIARMLSGGLADGTAQVHAAELIESFRGGAREAAGSTGGSRGRNRSRG